MKDSTGLQTSGTAVESTDNSTIEGPIAEYDRYGDYTGHDFFRCTSCGVEAMRRRDLRAGGCNCSEVPQR